MSEGSLLDQAAAHKGLARPEDRGRLLIADKVVERIAKRAAGEMPGTTDVGGRWSLPLIGTNFPKVTARIAGHRARLHVEVASPWPSSAPTTAAMVRDRVAEQVARLTGITVDAVDVTIAEVVYVKTARGRVQ